jgi:ABC-type antimicrobial peptide transport system ATPase subunit
MIAMAIACKPQLIADEPTTALDNRSKGNYPVVERHSARNGNEYHLFHMICRSFQLSPIGL